MRAHRPKRKLLPVVKMVRWFIRSGPNWSKWHITQDGERTWCGRRFRHGVLPKYDESQIKDWRGEKNVCGLCIRHFEAHGSRRGEHGRT